MDIINFLLNNWENYLVVSCIFGIGGIFGNEMEDDFIGNLFAFLSLFLFWMPLIALKFIKS